jgi:SAM-dependent methyltransferase
MAHGGQSCRAHGLSPHQRAICLASLSFEYAIARTSVMPVESSTGNVSVKGRLENFYDRFALIYDTVAMEETSIYKKILDRIDISANETAIDIGCGTGNIAMLLSSRFSKVTAIDLSSGMLKKAQKKLDAQGVRNVDLVKGDVFTHDFPESGFDCSFCVFILHHLDPENELITLMEKTAAITRNKIVVVDYKEKLTAWYRFFEWVEKSHVKQWLKLNPEQIWRRVNLRCTGEFDQTGYHVWELEKRSSLQRYSTKSGSAELDKT